MAAAGPEGRARRPGPLRLGRGAPSGDATTRGSTAGDPRAATADAGLPPLLVDLRDRALAASEAGKPGAAALWRGVMRAFEPRGAAGGWGPRRLVDVLSREGSAAEGWNPRHLVDVPSRPGGPTVLRRLLELGDVASLLHIGPRLWDDAHGRSATLRVRQFAADRWLVLVPTRQAAGAPACWLGMFVWRGENLDRCHWYLGEWQNNAAQVPRRGGHGRAGWASGDGYVGAFRDSAMHGAGCLRLADGSAFEGTFTAINVPRGASGGLADRYRVVVAPGREVELGYIADRWQLLSTHRSAAPPGASPES